LSFGTRGLTKEGLEALLASLGPDLEQAGQRYEQIRRKLIRLFEWRGCASPEDLADETINRVARRLAGGLQVRSDDPYAYFCGVAHLLYKEVLRQQARERRVLDGGDWRPPEPEEDAEPDVRLSRLQHCLGLLDAGQRRLLLRYHERDDRIRARKEICDELGIPMNALRIRVHRLRRRVESCVEERLRGLLGDRTRR